jgi:peroxiredoxin
MFMGILAGFFASAIPNAGDVAPDFTATDTEGKSHTLSKMVKDGPVIVAFFSKAFTPG